MAGSPYALEKQRAALQVAGGLLVTGVALLLLRSSLPPLPFLLMLFGVYVTARAFSRLTRLVAVERELFRQARSEFHREFRRSTLPRQVFWLLLAVAEVDGQPSASELELVRQFLLERFPDPVDADDIRSWVASRILPAQAGPLARSLAAVLSSAECETLFVWCCMVAFADESFAADEHDLLQAIAGGLGIPRHHARRLFAHAKRVHLSAGRFRGGFERPARAGLDRRRLEALQVLGLADGATTEEIRRRHRELAKKYHPDRHHHLGEVAAREAAERFREIQSAYEVLAG